MVGEAEEVHDKDLRHRGSRSRRGRKKEGGGQSKMKAGGATNVTGGIASNTEAEPAKFGCLKRPRLRLMPEMEPQKNSSGIERREDDVGGSTGEGAQGEVVTGAKEDASLGGSEVLVEGKSILISSLAQKTSIHKKKKACARPRRHLGLPAEGGASFALKKSVCWK